jgi:ATP-dependent DNA ligase
MQIIFPPRPRGKIHPNQLSREERRGKWMVQRKFNGTRNIIYVLGDRVVFYKGDGHKHVKFKPPSFLIREVLSLNLDPKKEYYFDSELIDLYQKNTVVLFDILAAGSYLIGESQKKRLVMLEDLCRNPQTYPTPPIALSVTKHIWLAEHWSSQFAKHFQEFLSEPVIEGLVLRETDSILTNHGHSPYDVDWQVRCRKPSGKYSF